MANMINNLGWVVCSLTACCLTVPVFASAVHTALGGNGIDALKLHEPPYNLLGRKVAIGQVEIGRPGMFGWDKAVSQNRSVSLSGVFLRDKPAKSDMGVDSHAHNVAGVMVSQDKAFRGVAPGARLYSSAVGLTSKVAQPEECLTAQHIANQNTNDVRAINFSFGEPLKRDERPDPVLDGKALLTLCLDWSSRVHDVLYVVAGNQGRGGIPIPTDNYNGINVAFSSARRGIFNKVDVSNLAAVNEGATARLAGKEFNVDGRRSIGLVAPGSNIPMLNPDGKLNKVTGTSFAAPQVTASVALLQEFADRQLHKKQFNRSVNWSLDARRHQVMKAVLLNSADKIQDNGDGLYLGMTRTLIDKQNQSWLASDAYKSPQIPLDAQMGTGHLNTFRAYEQFSAGQWSPMGWVPGIGWNYGVLEWSNTVDYSLDKPLKKGSFASVTLTWNRLVELNDVNQNNQYDIGEGFGDRGLNDLDLYLMRADTHNATAAVVCASVSAIDSVEHIFCPIPHTGNYKIRVHFRRRVNRAIQPYGLAWWTVAE